MYHNKKEPDCQALFRVSYYQASE